jgi:hypothetical protein
MKVVLGAGHAGRQASCLIMSVKQYRFEHPYAEFEGAPLWRAVDCAVSDVEESQGLQLRELRESVVGYICKQLRGLGVA